MEAVDLLLGEVDSFFVEELPLKLDVGRLNPRPRRLGLVDAAAEAVLSALDPFPEVLFRVELRKELSPAAVEVDCELLRRLLGRPPAGDIVVGLEVC